MKTTFFTSVSEISSITAKAAQKTYTTLILSPAPGNKTCTTHVHSRFHPNQMQQPPKQGQRNASQLHNTAMARNRKQESHELYRRLSFALRMFGFSLLEKVGNWEDPISFVSCQCSVACKPWGNMSIEVTLPMEAPCSGKGAYTQIQCYSTKLIQIMHRQMDYSNA